MKKLLILTLIIAVACGCVGKNKKSAEETTATEETAVVTPEHNARLSLEYWGTYRGVIPTKNAPGLQITITLTQDSTYVFNGTFLERSAEYDYNFKGSFSWNDAGNIITLHDITDGIQFYRIEENQIRMLDSNAEVITGAKAEKYVFPRLEETKE